MGQYTSPPDRGCPPPSLSKIYAYKPKVSLGPRSRGSGRRAPGREYDVTTTTPTTRSWGRDGGVSRFSFATVYLYGPGPPQNIHRELNRALLTGTMSAPQIKSACMNNSSLFNSPH